MSGRDNTEVQTLCAGLDLNSTFQLLIVEMKLCCGWFRTYFGVSVGRLRARAHKPHLSRRSPTSPADR